LINQIKVIIFDFDGVIAESVNIKKEAFAELYKPFGTNVVKKVVAFHMMHGGISRFEKIKLYHEKYLGVELTDKQIIAVAKQFSNLVVEKVINAPYVPGAIEFIKYWNRKYDMYISSATPQKEIEYISKQRNISRYFKGIYGSPILKSEHIKRILKSNKYNKNEVVFIGDAVSDRNAAKENMVRFIARVSDKNSPLVNENLKIKDLTILPKLIN